MSVLYQVNNGTFLTCTNGKFQNYYTMDLQLLGLSMNEINIPNNHMSGCSQIEKMKLIPSSW